MVLRSRSVCGGGWGRAGLFAGQQYWRRAAAPGKAYMSQGTWKRAECATSLGFSPPGSVCVCTSMCAQVPTRLSTMGREDAVMESGMGSDVINPMKSITSQGPALAEEWLQIIVRQHFRDVL